MKKVVIRSLGGAKIGYGHYYRCLSLAKSLIQFNEEMKIIFIVNKDLRELVDNTEFKYILENDLEKDSKIIEDLDLDLFILDSYEADDRYLKRIKEITRLMLIDDNNDIYDSRIPDILYNGNIHAENLNYPLIDDQIRLLGTRYLIMKEEYWQDKDPSDSKKEGILITTGGSDEHKVAVEILREIKNLEIKIKLIIGPGYDDGYIRELEKEASKNVDLIYKPQSLKEYIRNSELVITAGGSTVYEVLSQNTPPIIFSIADNQDLLCKEFELYGINYLGKYPRIEYERLKSIINKKESLIKDHNYIDLIDGRGVKRIINALIR